jgi:hypothetical protein
MKKVLIVVAVCAALGGCTTAGPFVTNISSNGSDGLNIEKCSVQMNGFTGAISNKDCISTVIRLRPGQ